MSFRVLLPQDVASEGIAELESAGIEVVRPASEDPEDLRTAIADCQAVLVRTTPLPADVLRAAPDLRVVSRHGVGVDNVDLDYCRAHGIRVTFAPSSSAVSVAQHAVMLMLASTRLVTRFDAAVRRGDFAARNSGFGIELEGKTLGVVGLGRIGQLAARSAAHGLGMTVIGYDPYVDQDHAGPAIRVAPLEHVLEAADVISLHVPLADSTRGLVDAAAFARMKPGAFLVNCSRGGVVDEAALVDALRSGRIRGAGIDVFEEEPLPPGHPLTEFDNVVLTPHMAAHTDDGMVRMSVHAARGIISVSKSEEPEWAVV